MLSSISRSSKSPTSSVHPSSLQPSSSVPGRPIDRSSSVSFSYFARKSPPDLGSALNEVFGKHTPAVVDILKGFTLPEGVRGAPLKSLLDAIREGTGDQLQLKPDAPPEVVALYNQIVSETRAILDDPTLKAFTRAHAFDKWSNFLLSAWMAAVLALGAIILIGYVGSYFTVPFAILPVLGGLALLGLSAKMLCGACWDMKAPSEAVLKARTFFMREDILKLLHKHLEGWTYPEYVRTPAFVNVEFDTKLKEYEGNFSSEEAWVAFDFARHKFLYVLLSHGPADEAPAPAPAPASAPAHYEGESPATKLRRSRVFV